MKITTTGDIFATANISIFEGYQLPDDVLGLHPAQGETDVQIDTDLVIELSGSLASLAEQQYAEESGIRLYRADELSAPVWSFSFHPDPDGDGIDDNEAPAIYLGQSTFTFMLPDLEPNTRYLILADYGWVRISPGGSVGGFALSRTANQEVWSFTTGDSQPSAWIPAELVIVDDNTLELRFSAVISQTYTVWSSYDMMEWDPVSELVADEAQEHVTLTNDFDLHPVIFTRVVEAGTD